jgi:hypothetical protein
MEGEVMNVHGVSEDYWKTCPFLRNIIDLLLSCILSWGTRAVIAIPRFGMGVTVHVR